MQSHPVARYVIYLYYLKDTIGADIWTKGIFSGYAGSDTILVQAAPQANFQNVWFDMGKPAPGVYIITLRTNHELINRKLVIY